MTEFFIGLYLLASAIVASLIAKRKNRSTNNWYTIGMLLGIVGIVVVSLMSPLTSDEAELR